MTDDTRPRNENLTGCFLGYDPGGEKGHGVAAIKVASGEVADHRVDTKNTVEEVLQWFRTWFQKGEPDSFGPVLGIGIDTLTYWSSGWAGWRMADQCLRCAYEKATFSEWVQGEKKERKIQDSVASPNFLMGAMCLNGMFVLRRLRSTINGLYVTETHPKVLFYALTKIGYRYASTNKKKPKLTSEEDRRRQLMNCWLCLRTGLRHNAEITENNHEWDALISAWAAFCGRSGKWPLNLLNEAHCCELLKETLGTKKWEFSGKNAEAEKAKAEGAETLEFPGGPVEYRWPHPNHS